MLITLATWPSGSRNATPLTTDQCVSQRGVDAEADDRLRLHLAGHGPPSGQLIGSYRLTGFVEHLELVEHRLGGTNQLLGTAVAGEPRGLVVGEDEARSHRAP